MSRDKPDLSRATARVQEALHAAHELSGNPTKTRDFPSENVWRVAKLILEEDDRLPTSNPNTW